MKRVKRHPAKKKIKRIPVKKPLVLSKKDPHDDVDDFNKALMESKKRVNEEFIDQISNEVGYIENLTETNLEPTRLYRYQKKFILDRSKYRHCDKSRQIGQSYGFACEGFAKSQLLDIYTGIFISYNQEEANEKIVYAKGLFEGVPYKYKKSLTVDRITALEWEGRTIDGKKTRTRLISHPQREPRGKGFNTDVFLDEIAHYQWQEKVYIAAVPIVTRGLGQLCMASSPLGKSGLHYEIGANTVDYNMYSRHKVFWWNNPDFLSADALKHDLDEIHELSKNMETSDRVLEFGNDAVIQAYKSMLEEYFQQEYELKAIDEMSSYYPMELIKGCTFDALLGLSKLEDGDEYGDNPIYEEPVYPKVELECYETIEELSHAIARGKVSKRLIAGYDIGRREDSSEIIVLEELPEYDYLQVVRLIISLKRASYRNQFETVDRLFKFVPVKSLKVDSTGIGDNLAEDLQRRFHSRVIDVNFNNENKGDMATNLKLRMEDRSLAYPNDRDLIRQIHSIKRKVSESSLVKYEVAPQDRRKHHGDKFWALALGSSAGEPAQMHKVTLVASQTGKPLGETRLIPSTDTRLFKKTPVVYGVDFKKLPPPPKHDAEFEDLSNMADV